MNGSLYSNVLSSDAYFFRLLYSIARCSLYRATITISQRSNASSRSIDCFNSVSVACPAVMMAAKNPSLFG